MKISWIPAALSVVLVVGCIGCTSDKERMTPPPAPPGPNMSPPTAGVPLKPEGPVPAKVDSAKLKEQGGVTYAILKPGSGPEIKTHQQAVVHYTGWTQSDSAKFDSSRDRGEPYAFVIDEAQVIKGWHIGVKGMKKGELRQLIIPAPLGYAEAGRPPIPPNATLVFEIELMEIGEHSH